MLRPRLIPSLLVQNGGLVKTVNFGDPKYVGDPINAVRIFNEKEVDELIVLDIDATRQNREPDYRLIANLAVECRMPLCYGGGVRTVETVERIVGLGVEKVAISAAVVARPALVAETAARVGSQSVVVVIDVKKFGLTQRYEVVTHNATQRTGLDPISTARRAQELGAGEVVINSVDNDGLMNGYDLSLIGQVHEKVSIPITALGGAGSLADIERLFERYETIGASAGSLFVFKGKYRAVLINYPSTDEKTSLLNKTSRERPCIH